MRSLLKMEKHHLLFPFLNLEIHLSGAATLKMILLVTVFINGGNKIASIKAGSALSYQVGNGSYYVTAVDVAGQESAAVKYSWSQGSHRNLKHLMKENIPVQTTPDTAAEVPKQQPDSQDSQAGNTNTQSSRYEFTVSKPRDITYSKSSTNNRYKKGRPS